MLLPAQKEGSLRIEARMASSSRETDGHLEATSKARASEAMAKEEVHLTRRNNSSTRTRRKHTLLQSNETHTFQKQK